MRLEPRAPADKSTIPRIGKAPPDAILKPTVAANVIKIAAPEMNKPPEKAKQSSREGRQVILERAKLKSA